MNVAHEMNGKGAAKKLPVSEEIDLSLIDPSPTQPRRVFDAVALKELADTIATHGVLEDILVRPSPTKKGRFELVFGERRVRASKLAGKKTIPAKMRDLTDVQVLEIQIIENARRQDIHPLEEADAYEALHKKHGYSVEEIAAKVGKSTATIYARLKFCALTPDARTAFLDGQLDAAKALLLARIPHEDLQKKALAELTKVDDWRKEPPSFREAQEIVRKKFMLRLVEAPFDRADANLVVGVPACSACPKRTGNQRELFSDLETKDDLCTDTKCFKSKCDADWAKRAEAAKAKGQEVLADKKAKGLFGYGGDVSYNAPFVDLDAKTYVNGKERTNRSLLGKHEVAITLTRDPNGKPRELVDRKAFEKATKDATATKAAKPSAAEKRWEAERQAEQKQRERAAKKRAADLVEIVTKAEKRQPNDAFWRAVAIAAGRAVDFQVEDVLERRGVLKEDEVIDLEKSFRDLVVKLTGAQARGLLVETLVDNGFGGDETIATFRSLYGIGKKKAAKR